MKKPSQLLPAYLRLKAAFHRPKTAAVILAGGQGTRMGTDTTKQLLMLDGKPVLVHTLLAFEKCKMIDELVMVVRPSEKEIIALWCKEYGIQKCRTLVTGGDTRQMSAENGVAAVSSGISYVAIHDAARCLITPEQITRVVLWAYAYHAASAVTTVVDTVKTVNARDFITETIDRKKIRLAATPQVFHLPYYQAAVKLAEEKGVSVTDDNALMELIGQRVKAVDTGYENFKITHPEDILRAETILRKRREDAHE